jgi:hypothetical protein
MNDAAIGEARMAYDRICVFGMESRREHPNDLSSFVFHDERKILEAIPMVSQKPTFVEEGAVPRLGC